jgi:hypothetical protein
MRLLSRIKNSLIRGGKRPRKIVLGPLSGIVMRLDLQSDTQLCLGLFEKETHRDLIRLSRNLSSAIDVGAAPGEYALYFLMKTSASRIYLFEPDELRTPMLRDNLSLNGLDASERLVWSRQMVGETSGEGKIALDSLIPELRDPCLIKVDVDGGEAEILRGAAQLNKRYDVRWIIETHSESLEAECIGILREAGLRTRIIRNAWWRAILPEQRPGRNQNRWLAAWSESGR